MLRNSLEMHSGGREKEVNVSYVGFSVDDKFVLGYGLDYDEGYRNLTYIGYIE